VATEPESEEVDAEDERFEAILSEKDPFRLSIRGMSLIEEVVDEAIAEAFRGGTPRELKRLSLPVRLALAQALELLTAELVITIKDLASIRNDFAHGFDDELTADHWRVLVRILTPFMPDDFDANDYSDGDLLRIAVPTVLQATELVVQRGLDRRAAAEEAIAKLGRVNALTPEQVRRLLDEEDEDADAIER
jgi:hypothetical protein